MCLMVLIPQSFHQVKNIQVRLECGKIAAMV